MNRARADEPKTRRHEGMDHQPSPEEIERDLARTRADLNDTLSAIEHRLSPGELVDQALDYLRGGPKEFAVNLGTQARDNPVPVALMAVSLGWLMFGSRPSARGVYGEEYTSEGIAEGGYGKAGESIERAGEAISGKAEEMRAKAGRKISEAREKMGSAEEKTGRRAETMRQRAHGMAAGVRRGSGEMASGIRHTGERARGSYSYLLREQPITLGALGVALGAILGAGLPTTAREGKAASRVREMGREQMERTGEELKQAVSEPPPAQSSTPPH